MKLYMPMTHIYEFNFLFLIMILPNFDWYEYDNDTAVPSELNKLVNQSDSQQVCLDYQKLSSTQTNQISPFPHLLWYSR